MHAIQEALHGSTSLWGYAHPDDPLTTAIALAAIIPGDRYHAAIASSGDRTTVNNYRSSRPNFIQDGGRTCEALAIASFLGFSSLAQYRYPDGYIAQHTDEFAHDLAERALHIGATALVSTLGQSDHDDHRAAGIAAEAASRELAKRTARPIIVIQFANHEHELPENSDAVRAIALPSQAAIRFTLSAVQLNGSQHQIKRADTVPDERALIGWQITADGEFYVSNETLHDLSQYPIWRPAYANVSIVDP